MATLRGVNVRSKKLCPTVVPREESRRYRRDLDHLSAKAPAVSQTIVKTLDPYGVFEGDDAPDVAAVKALLNIGAVWGNTGTVEAVAPKHEAEAAIVEEEHVTSEIVAAVGLYAPRPTPRTKNKTVCRVKARPVTTAAPKETQVSLACTKCAGELRNLETGVQCQACGLVVDISPDDDVHAQNVVSRLRMVGPKGSFYQPDLDRSSSANSDSGQCRQIFDEFMSYRQQYIDTGGRAFPINTLQIAADKYREIQRQVTKRSHNKKSIMAVCLRLACADINFAPDKREFADFMQLGTRGIARGDNFVRAMNAEGVIQANVNKTMEWPNIVTTFQMLKYDGDEYEGLRRAAADVVAIATAENIGMSSVTRSRAVGACYLVIKRAAVARGMDPRVDAAKVKMFTIPQDLPRVAFMPLADFCDICQIRKSTIERFVAPLRDCHSHFEETYKKAGVYYGPLKD